MSEERWKVCSTIIEGRCLLVRDGQGRTGIVEDPTPEEWEKAFHAPSNPYPWAHPERVTAITEHGSDAGASCEQEEVVA